MKEHRRERLLAKLNGPAQDSGRVWRRCSLRTPLRAEALCAQRTETLHGGPQTNDLVLQLPKRRIDRIVLGGMLANICVESHLRDFLEQGFEVAIARDATAGPRHPEWGDGYTAALTNFRFLAHALLTTDEIVSALAAGASAAR